MKIELKHIAVRDLLDGYIDQEESGVRAFGGKLDVRPPYQREFVYKDAQRDAVIDTVKKGYPLNVMYWATREDGTFEIIDGQQRTISICRYVNGDFSFNKHYFHNLTKDKQDEILDYELTVYFCTGTESEKLEWFKTINIAGEELTDQELRNAVYHGPWVTDAKRYFSKTSCAAYQVASDLMNGSCIRQDYLKTTLDWITDGKGEAAICEYMAKNSQKPTALDEWKYFQNTFAWVDAIFGRKWKKEQKGLPWGILYNHFKDKQLNPNDLREQIETLMEDDEINNKKGIFEYVLTGNERCLNLRTFTHSEKRTVYQRQKGICPLCHEHFDIEEMEGDHITPWSQGGKTNLENCQMLCKDCNRRKSNK